MSRTPASVELPTALTIATSDSGGGAGIQADLKTMEACGTFGTSVLCATTAQNTQGVESVHVLPTEEIGAQLEAVCGDFEVGAAKTGMLATAEVVEFVAERAQEFSFPLVVDPVMVATSGDRLLEPAGEAAYEDLIAEATLVTPNAQEATVLTDVAIDGEEAAIEAGEAIRGMGAAAALMKGGHIPDEAVGDVLVGADGTKTFTHPRVGTDATHGSGCTLASAIAAHLARGEDLEEAVGEGIDLLSRAVRYPLDVGEGPGTVHHLVEIRERAARDATASAVREAVDSLVVRDVAPLVPEVGTNVAGATPYAETIEEVAAVEGRMTNTPGGARPTRGVAFGASEHAARFLLAAREEAPELRFALDCRFDGEIEAALAGLDGPVVELTGDRRSGSADGTPERAIREAFSGTKGEASEGDASGGTPVAGIERDPVDREALAWIVASDSETLVERATTVLDALDGSKSDSA
jgi:hydroxymethylpyrimidine/phosphomethylpyrimidine kinase